MRPESGLNSSLRRCRLSWLLLRLCRRPCGEPMAYRRPLFDTEAMPRERHGCLQASVRLDLNYPPTPVGGIGDFDEDAECRLDLKASVMHP